MPEEVTPEEHLRTQAWNYFEVHAAQRLTTFRFYLVLSTATTAAIFVTFQRDYRVPSVGIVLSLLLVFFAFVFWKLEGRNRELVRLAEEALKFFEEEANLPDEGGKPHRAKLFSREASVTRDKEQARSPKVHFSYSTCFKAVFVTFAATGLVTLSMSLYLAFVSPTEDSSSGPVPETTATLDSSP